MNQTTIGIIGLGYVGLPLAVEFGGKSCTIGLDINTQRNALLKTGVGLYYLRHKAETVGYNPEIIQASRHLNDSMGNYIVSQVIKLMLKKRIHIAEAKILVMGLTFKENCPDIRNSRVIDIINEFKNYGSQVDVHDPWVDPQQTLHEYNITPIANPLANHYDAIILAVKHGQFIQMGAEAIRALGKDQHVLYDIKYLLPANRVDGRL